MTITVAQRKKEALEALKNLSEDISLLASGDWAPDDDSCEASLESIERVRDFIESLEI